MKDFMFIFTNPVSRPHPTAEEMQGEMQKWMDWIDRLKKKNIYVAGEALHPGGKIVQGAKKLVTDGPFAESKEVVGGYFIIKADSLEKAAELAKDSPDLAYGGSVEVREVIVF